MKHVVAYPAVLLAVAAFPAAANAMTPAEYESKVAEINQRYQPTYDAAMREGDKLRDRRDGCAFEAVWDADWEMTTVSFDWPVTTFKNREFSFNTVKTRFVNKTILSTDTPKTYFEVKNVLGVKTKVPVIRMERTEITTKVPEFQWGRTSFTVKLPEFSRKRVESKFHILKIKKVREWTIPCKRLQEDANGLEKKVATASASHQSELQAVTRAYTRSQANQLLVEMEKAEAEFDRALRSIDDAMREMRANGIDPTTFVVTTEDGTKSTLAETRDSLAKQKLEVLLQLRNQHSALLESLTQ